jgi:hypothetical protein
MVTGDVVGHLGLRQFYSRRADGNVKSVGLQIHINLFDCVAHNKSLNLSVERAHVLGRVETNLLVIGALLKQRFDLID